MTKELAIHLLLYTLLAGQITADSGLAPDERSQSSQTISIELDRTEEKKSCCEVSDNEAATQETNWIDEYFVPTMTCTVKCREKGKETLTVTRTFRPQDHDLFPGDGSDGRSAPWAGFTMTFEAWSRFACLESASSSCGSLTAVEQVNLVRISSGDWTLDGRIPCPTRRQARRIGEHDRNSWLVFPDYTPILSPFQRDAGAITTAGSNERPAQELPFPAPGAVLTGPRGDPTQRNVDTYEYWKNRAVTFGEIPRSVNRESEIQKYLLESRELRSKKDYVERMKKENGIPPTSECRNVIRGRACFGDCLTFPENRAMMQFMATNQVDIENVDDFAVCGDNLVEFFGKNEMSESAREIYCEKFVASSLVAGRARAVPCSAYRIRVDCSSLY